MSNKSETREGTPTVQTGDYVIPKHNNWIEVDGKYLVDFNDLITKASTNRAIEELELLDKMTKKHVYVERDGYLKDRIKELKKGLS